MLYLTWILEWANWYTATLNLRYHNINYSELLTKPVRLENDLTNHIMFSVLFVTFLPSYSKLM